MKNKKPKHKSSFEIYMSIRKTWNGINPATRIEQSKKIYDRRKEKLNIHKEKEEL